MSLHRAPTVLERIRDFEAAQGFDLPGGYGGIGPPYAAEAVAEWVRYLLGEAHPEYDEPSNGITWLLGCDCSDAGCWPLEARVTVDGDRVIWHQFRQPHRPQQDYSAFGPFIFDRDAYEVAVKDLAAALAIPRVRK
jgi:hypothetical protein